jgi:hypothetical protein
VIEIQSILLLPGHDFLLGTHIKGLFLGESGECLVVCTLPKLEHAPYLGCNTLSEMTRGNGGGLSPKVQGDGRLASLFLDPTQDAISRASSTSPSLHRVKKRQHEHVSALRCPLHPEVYLCGYRFHSSPLLQSHSLSILPSCAILPLLHNNLNPMGLQVPPPRRSGARDCRCYP